MEVSQCAHPRQEFIVTTTIPGRERHAQQLPCAFPGCPEATPTPKMTMVGALVGPGRWEEVQFEWRYDGKLHWWEEVGREIEGVQSPCTTAVGIQT